MELDPRLIVEVPSGGALERQLRTADLDAVASGEVTVAGGPTDAMGALEAAAAGRVVMSVSAPQALPREAEDLRRAIAREGAGAEPLVVVVEAAEELSGEQIDSVLAAAQRAHRPVILRVEREVPAATPSPGGEMSSELPTLYVCHGDEGGPRLHPCRRVQEAFQAAGIPYEKVVAAHGSPIPFLRKGSREELREATGQEKLPALRLADGTVITPARAILRWVAAQPQPAAT